MNPEEASWRLLSLLWQASWQGAIFAVAVGLICLLFRVPAPVRAWLWFLAAVKFFGGFLYLIFSGRGMPLTVPMPAPLISSVSRAGVIQVPSFYFLAPWVIAAWGVGIFLCIVLTIVRTRATYKSMSCAQPCPAEAIPSMLAVLSNRLGVAHDQIPPVCVAPNTVEGPQVMLSGRKCVVILPETLLPPSPVALSEADLRFVIAHELAHIRRNDLWAGLLFAAMQTLFFFHPCAVWVKREWEAAREEACDLLALYACADGNRDSAAQYGALLLRLGSGDPSSNIASAGFATSPFVSLRRRLTHLRRHQTEVGRRFSYAFVLIGLPVLAALLLPLEPRWEVTATEIHSVIRVPSPKQVLSASKQVRPVPTFTHSAMVTAPKTVPGVKLRSKKVYAFVTATNQEPVAVPTPVPHRPFAPPSPDPLIPISVTPAIPMLSEPLQVAGDVVVKPVATANVAAPIPVEPEIAENLADESPAVIVAEAVRNTVGEASSPTRLPDTLSARTPGIPSDVKGVAHYGPVSPSLENTRSIPIPTAAPSPPTAPAFSQEPVTEPDATRTPRR